MSWWIWLIIAGIFLIMEIFTHGFLVFWFSIGALITMIVSIFTTNIFIQLLIFVITSTILILFTKKFSEKIRKIDSEKTFNVDAVIGEIGIVKKEVSSIKFGVVKVGGSTWTAITKDDTIPEGQQVIVKGIDGVKLIVERKTEI